MKKTIKLRNINIKTKSNNKIINYKYKKKVNKIKKQSLKNNVVMMINQNIMFKSQSKEF